MSSLTQAPLPHHTMPRCSWLFLACLLPLLAAPPSYAQVTAPGAQTLTNPALQATTPHAPFTSMERPPLTTGRLAAEAVLGALGGASFGGVGGLIGSEVGSLSCDEGEWFCGLGGAIIGVGIGITLGTAVGVYGAGAYGDQDGSFGATLAGSLLGGVAGIALAAATNDAESPVLSALALSMPLWGAMIGFNRTRRYDAAASMAVLTLHGGTPRLGIPLVSPVPDPLTHGPATAWRATLITARW